MRFIFVLNRTTGISFSTTGSIVHIYIHISKIQLNFTKVTSNKKGNFSFIFYENKKFFKTKNLFFFQDEKLSWFIFSRLPLFVLTIISCSFFSFSCLTSTFFLNFCLVVSSTFLFFISLILPTLTILLPFPALVSRLMARNTAISSKVYVCVSTFKFSFFIYFIILVVFYSSSFYLEVGLATFGLLRIYFFSTGPFGFSLIFVLLSFFTFSLSIFLSVTIYLYLHIFLFFSTCVTSKFVTSI